jgi:6-phosphofructokinase 1
VFRGARRHADRTIIAPAKVTDACPEALTPLAPPLAAPAAAARETIDNDIGLIDRSFGFLSAVEAAQGALNAARVEATGNMPNGIALVKLMGRSSGFLAAYATLASSDVDLCLVPEVRSL